MLLVEFLLILLAGDLTLGITVTQLMRTRDKHGEATLQLICRCFNRGPVGRTGEIIIIHPFQPRKPQCGVITKDENGTCESYIEFRVIFLGGRSRRTVFSVIAPYTIPSAKENSKHYKYMQHLNSNEIKKLESIFRILETPHRKEESKKERNNFRISKGTKPLLGSMKRPFSRIQTEYSSKSDMSEITTTAKNTFNPEITMSSIKGDISKIFIKGIIPKKVIKGDTPKNVIKGDTPKNVIRGETSGKVRHVESKQMSKNQREKSSAVPNIDKEDKCNLIPVHPMCVKRPVNLVCQPSLYMIHRTSSRRYKVYVLKKRFSSGFSYMGRFRSGGTISSFQLSLASCTLFFVRSSSTETIQGTCLGKHTSKSRTLHKVASYNHIKHLTLDKVRGLLLFTVSGSADDHWRLDSISIAGGCHRIIKTIDIDMAAIAIHPATHSVYYIEAYSNNVWILDYHTNKVQRRAFPGMMLGRQRSHIFISTWIGRLYVCVPGQNYINAVDIVFSDRHDLKLPTKRMQCPVFASSNQNLYIRFGSSLYKYSQQGTYMGNVTLKSSKGELFGSD